MEGEEKLKWKAEKGKGVRSARRGVARLGSWARTVAQCAEVSLWSQLDDEWREQIGETVARASHATRAVLGTSSLVMVLLRSCCCWRSVRKGSFACGIYTLIFYAILVAAGICHVNSVLHSPVRFTLSLFLLTFSALCVVSSVILLLGLFFDNRLLLIPWLIIVSMTTLLDVVLSLYLVTDLPVNPFVITMYVIDYILCAVNVYCILCVLSQYREYTVGRRALGQTSRPSLSVVSRYSCAQGRSSFSRVASWPSGRFARKFGRRTTNNALSPANDTPEKPNFDTFHALDGQDSLRPDLKTEPFFGQEEVSSGLHISTAETSLQPSEEEADLPADSARTTHEDARTHDQETTRNMNSKEMQQDLKDRLIQKCGSGKTKHLSPVPETRSLLNQAGNATNDGSSVNSDSAIHGHRDTADHQHREKRF